jgi:hypothetical protein
MHRVRARPTTCRPAEPSTSTPASSRWPRRSSRSSAAARPEPAAPSGRGSISCARNSIAGRGARYHQPPGRLQRPLQRLVRPAAGAAQQRPHGRGSWLLLTYILPGPVMVLATNRRSTGIGVRPAADRIEITVDFTPSPALMIATATLITGIVREVMTWDSFDLHWNEHDIPVLGDSSRCRTPPARAGSPVQLLSAQPVRLRHQRAALGNPNARHLSLRQVAGTSAARFRRSIRRLSDPFTYRLIQSVMSWPQRRHCSTSRTARPPTRTSVASAPGTTCSPPAPAPFALRTRPHPRHLRPDAPRRPAHAGARRHARLGRRGVPLRRHRPARGHCH